jgi:hypothetical protein
MPPEKDIRDRETITPLEVSRLNFIRDPAGAFLFRPHLRRGLRSHLMEVLRTSDVKRETRGVLEGGIRRFPRAAPVKMLRLFRRRFAGLDAALEEIRRFKGIRRMLSSRHLGISNEFLVDYRSKGRYDIMLCGLQEFVSGVELDPWHPDPLRLLSDQYDILAQRERFAGQPDRETWLAHTRDSIDDFAVRIKKLVQEEGLIPDLAGVRNLLVTRLGEVKLVDINNISKAPAGPEIRLDDLGYPVGDKSVEVVGRLEIHCLGRTIAPDGFYRTFFDADRRQQVAAQARAFNDKIQSRGMCDK